MYISAKCSVAVHCLLFIHEYGETHKVTSDLLSKSSGSNPVTIRGILSALKKEGILSVRFGSGGAKLLCPLEEITLYRICKAIEPDFLLKTIGIHPMPSPYCPVGRNIHGVLDCTYETIRLDLGRSLQNITMAEIVESYHRLLREEQPQ